MKIPFNKASLAGNELDYLRDAVERGHISGDGFYTRRCQECLEELTEANKVLLTTSCTHALEMAALLLDIKPGDEVIVPSFTFVSTANAFALFGAKPVFCDIRDDTLNLNEQLLSELITPRTRAIVPVHYAGVGCEMQSIMRTAERSGVAVVEDNAHGLFGTYREKPLGSFGCLATQSFHETKNVTCGEGGALLINDAQLIERAEIIREKGTDRTKFFRGELDKYSWLSIGSSYLPSDMLAAFLWAQLEERESIQTRRKAVWNRYSEGIAQWAKQCDVLLPYVPHHCKQPWHMFYVLMPSIQARNSLITHLKARGIPCLFHYLPLHLSEMGRKFGGKRGDCPVTEDVSDRILRLPFYSAMEEDHQVRILEAIRGFCP